MNNPFQNVQKEKVVEFLKKNLWGILFFVVLIAIDLVTKIVAEVYFTAEDAPLSIPIIPGYLELCLAYNRGMSFSIGATAPTWLKIAVIMGTCVMFIALTNIPIPNIHIHTLLPAYQDDKTNLPNNHREV